MRGRPARPLDRPARARLAFRELGLAIGLHAVHRMIDHPAVRDDPALDQLRDHLRLLDAIESTWREPTNRRSATWIDHRDINDVMLATSLAPDGVLALPER